MIERIKKYDLCLGCGLCSSVLGDNVCHMILNKKGFYEPILNKKLSEQDNKLIEALCPGIHIECSKFNGVWGPILSVFQAWSTNGLIRHKAASGGVVTSLAICLLEHQIVNAILQVGVCDDSYLINELRISRTKEDIIKNAQSRYAPALVFHNIKQIFDSNDFTFALIGKPCDIAGMQNFLSVFPQFKNRIKFYLSIFCAGMPSYNATIQTWKLSGHTDCPIRLKYRGDGWPGYFKAYFKDGSLFQLSYNESWGNILGKQLGFRCKICPDGIGLLSDIAVGDSWNTNNGYPDFTEDEGRSFCMVRTDRGRNLFEFAVQKGYIEKQDLDINKIKEQQPYQFERRKLEGWRLLPVQFYTRHILRFKGLSIWRQSIKCNLKKGIINAIGTYNRIRKTDGQQ